MEEDPGQTGAERERRGHPGERDDDRAPQSAPYDVGAELHADHEHVQGEAELRGGEEVALRVAPRLASRPTERATPGPPAAAARRARGRASRPRSSRPRPAVGRVSQRRRRRSGRTPGWRPAGGRTAPRARRCSCPRGIYTRPARGAQRSLARELKADSTKPRWRCACRASGSFDSRSSVRECRESCRPSSCTRPASRDITIYEKTDRLGGTWRENTYPGVACDVPSHLYTYSFEPNPDWSRALLASAARSRRTSRASRASTASRSSSGMARSSRWPNSARVAGSSR